MTSWKVPVQLQLQHQEKKSKKEVRFDRLLKKTSGPGLDAPFLLWYTGTTSQYSSSDHYTQAASPLEGDKRGCAG